TNPDRLAQFDYIAPAVSADRSVRDRAFDELREAKHRRIEPWAQPRLYYLNHPLLPTAETVSRIAPALALLPEVQLTGDIFFPGRWSASVLAPHRSPEARRVVEDFLATHTDYPALLTGKIRIAMYGLMR
ncbi:MAG: aminopeptidase, partial [Bacteroidales bacterium]|nr:aminopeptidase [Candidatus Equimonas enterica]